MVDPAQSPVELCVVRRLSGLYCPGCGATRALHALLHLDVAGALSYNAFLTPLLPLLAYIVAAELLRMIAGRYLLRPLPISPVAVAAIGIAFVLFGVARNLPPLAFLAPP